MCLPHPFTEVLQILPIMLVQKQSKGKEKNRNLNSPVLDDLPSVRSFLTQGVQLRLGIVWASVDSPGESFSRFPL